MGTLLFAKDEAIGSPLISLHAVPDLPRAVQESDNNEIHALPARECGVARALQRLTTFLLDRMGDGAQRIVRHGGAKPGTVIQMIR